jgi:hypothetical protein
MTEEEIDKLREQLETLTITAPAYDTCDNMSTTITSLDASTITTINLDDFYTSTCDTITLGGTGAQPTMIGQMSGYPQPWISATPGVTPAAIPSLNLDDYANVTKTEHKELIERVERLEKALTEEAELRAQHPALKMAYDEYRLLLVLAKQHTTDILTDE